MIFRFNTNSGYQILDSSGKLVKMWTNGVYVDQNTMEQLALLARCDFIYKHIAVMPDCHWGMGSTVGSVIPTQRAIMPAAVGVDIGCGMDAIRLKGLTATDFHKWGLYKEVRSSMERFVPHGRSDGTVNDVGSWKKKIPNLVKHVFTDEIYHEKGKPSFQEELSEIVGKNPGLPGAVDPETQAANMLGTLGTGNHFLELSVDENDKLWLVVHSGSRGIGARMGLYFTKQAKALMEQFNIKMPHPDLAFLPRDHDLFSRYWQALDWAQRYAYENRKLMLQWALDAMNDWDLGVSFSDEHVFCHHNFTAWEHHFGQNVMVTRKGAIRARKGDLGIIPGSMGTATFIVKGKGDPDSFTSCSHGAGRIMSRTAAKKNITLAQHLEDTQGVECIKDESVLDESPGAYKDIDSVMAAQTDLVDVVHTLKAIINVKGTSPDKPSYKKKSK